MCSVAIGNEIEILVGAEQLSAEDKLHSRSTISGALCQAVSSFGTHLEL